MSRRSVGVGTPVGRRSRRACRQVASVGSISAQRASELRSVRFLDTQRARLFAVSGRLIVGEQAVPVLELSVDRAGRLAFVMVGAVVEEKPPGAQVRGRADSGSNRGCWCRVRPP